MDHAFVGLDFVSNLVFMSMLCCGALALPHIIGWLGSPWFYVSGYTALFFVFRWYGGEDIHPAYSKSSFLFVALGLVAMLFERYKDSVAAWATGSVAMSLGTLGLVYWLTKLTPL